MSAAWDDVDGVLLLDKPSGISSNWALQLCRRLLNARKAGHTGTLDPMASGLLPLTFGNATKFGSDLLRADKSYLATVRFGAATDTMDATGQVIERSDRTVDAAQLEQVLPRFRGTIEQVPPMYSAIKREGRNLYELARRGLEVPRPPRQVEILTLDLLSCDGTEAVLATRVSKGTYIRSLAHDLGRALGVPAHLAALRRTAVGPLSLDDAVPFATLDDRQLTVESRRSYLKGPDFLLSSLPPLRLDRTTAARFRLGQRLSRQTGPVGPVRVYGPDDLFLGVAALDRRGVLRPSRLIRAPGD